MANYLEGIMDDGRLQNRHGSIEQNCDSHGWLFLRCRETIGDIKKSRQDIISIKSAIGMIKKDSRPKSAISRRLDKILRYLEKKKDEYGELEYEIKRSLDKSITGLLKFHTRDNFETNLPKETWMDSEFNGNARGGARIEIQALRLCAYRLSFELFLDEKYKILENILKEKARMRFFDGKLLSDGIDDKTTRPNIFIAAHAYENLLSQKEWEVCIENSLKSLWLEWGGISTIGKDSGLFCDMHTGENSRSYHLGDSWFWLNNLSAAVMHRINREKFKKEIISIAKASTEEILWRGCIGCHSELSDARDLSSKGCFSQTWSNAMYIEMIEEIY